MEIVNKPRSKTFVSMDSLWYEEERLSTFIDWPVSFISPQELAREGFYYLRTKDHCACAFCRGIIGAWEQGDTPRGEHLRHFPHCPFVQGKVTPNVPITQGSILARVSREVTADVGSVPTGIDVCGLGKTVTLQEYCNEGRVLTKSSSAEVSMSSLGFRQYCGPKRKEYLTTETRLNSFKHWPEKVKQTPEELAEAGFYYCGLSDHVRCFHCGKGLRNWEPDDDPWVEHARWFPDCHFVLLKKGMEYVDKVRRENPPYIPVRNRPLLNAASSSSPKPLALNDDEMEKLMELQIMRHVLDMGFAPHVVKRALRKKLMESGQPFFSVEACIDAILLILEEETKNTIHGCEDITAQVRKMAAIESSSSSNLNSSGSRSETLPRRGVEASVIALPTLPARQENDASSTQVSSLPPLPNNNFTTSNSVSITPILNISRASPPLRSSTPTSHLEQASPQSMNIETEQETVEGASNPIINDSNNSTAPVEIMSQTESATGNSVLVSSNSEDPSSNDEPMELPAEVATLISEADDVMEEAAKLLGTSASSTSSSSSSSSASTSLSSGSSTSQISSSSSSSHESHSSLESNVSSSQESYSAETSGPSSLTPASSSDESISPPRSPLKKDIIIVKSSSKLEEKGETLQKAGDVKTDNLAMELQRIKENMMCKVCMDKEMDVVFLPCTHMVTCSSCAVALASCPICRRDIQYAFKPIIS